MYIIIGNIIAFLASILMVYSGILKSKKKVLYVQTIQIGLFVISDIVLGGITGAIINTISCFRNILSYKNKLTLNLKIVIALLSIFLSVIFNNMGFIGLLPMISTIIYLIFIDIKDITKFKIVLILTMILWLIYDIYINSYTSALFDFFSIITNIISIIQIKKIYK